MKVAIIHEFVVRMGGAERVLSEFLEMFPSADVFCLVYDQDLKNKHYKNTKFTASSVQNYPNFLKRKTWLFVNKFSSEVEKWDLSEYDLVISSSNSFAHGVITNIDTLHICYYHSPTRYIWDWKNEYLEEKSLKGWKKLVADYILSKLRVWDQMASLRPDVRIANSENVKKRIAKYYRQESEVIYPPVDIDRFMVSDQVEDYYLVVSTLTPFKKIELAVEACLNLGLKLKIVGDGKDRGRLEQIAGGNSDIEFLGFQSDEKVADYMSKCKGFIFCGEEDFGITPVEVMASGRPVLALRKGGLLETVVEGETGLFFDESSVESLQEKLIEFGEWIENEFMANKSVERAKSFSREVFRKNFMDVVNKESKN